MKKLNIAGILLGLGIGVFTNSCLSSNNPSEELILKRNILLYQKENILVLGYDLNNDQLEDWRNYYSIKPMQQNKSILELIMIQQDKNLDGFFSDDEIVWEKEE